MVVGDLEIRLRADIARLQADMTQARRVVTETQDKINAAANAMKTALAGIGIGAGLAEIIKMADEYAKFTAQLRLASTSAADYAASYDAVKRIAKGSAQELATTGVLYARIANGTRELGVTQQRVADITETVNLALMVSGATATESASAQLQLSQAFASGTLRGEEFNAVNEAAPRLMKALADGMGLPIGALKGMAGEGMITSKIMAEVLPKALESLREEGKNIQTISGAFTVLKNEMLEFFGIQAQANGTVSLITGAIRFLSENLEGLVIILKTLTAYQVGTWFAAWAARTYQQVSASIALRASTVAAAEAEMARTTTLVAQSQAAIAGLAVTHEATLVRLRSANADRVAAQAAIAAASAAGALSFALRTVRLATAELAVAETLRAAYLTESAALDRAKVVAIGQLTAATAAQVAAQAALNGVTAAGITAAGVASKAIGFLGGPIGATILLIGALALAWQYFGKKAKEANELAAESFEQAHDRIIKALDTQIDKQENLLQLKNLGLTNQQAEKELPIIKQLEAASKRMGELNARTGDFAGISNDDALFKRIELTKQINELLDKQAKATKGAADVAIVTGNEAYKEWKKTYATREEQRAAEIADLKSRNLNAEQYAEILGRINLKYADNGAAKSLKQEETAYKTLVASIQEKLEANKLEALGFESMTDAQKMTVKLNAAILADKTKLNGADIERARVLIAQVAAEDAQLLSGKNVKKALQELKDERDKDAASAFDEIEANKQAIATFGLTKAQIEELTLARMEDRLARRGPQDLDLDEAEVNHLTRMIGLQKEKAATAATLGALDAGTDVTKAKELLDILTAVDNAAKDAASGMAASFGAVGQAIGGMTTALSGFSRDQAAIAAQLATSMKDAGGDPDKIAKAQAMAAQQGAQAQVRSYGDMAKAAKGFFKENTAGYKVMEGAEKAYRAYEMAMAVESMVKKIFFKEGEVAANLALNATKLTGEAATTAASTGLAATEASAWGITAVVKALASLPFPLNLAAGAATLAAVVAIGAKMFGGMGGSSVSLSQQRQAANGTGTVLGDSSAKSESIAHSLAIMEKNSGLGLAHTISMDSSLKQMVAGIGNLSSLLARSGVTAAGGGAAAGVQTGTTTLGGSLGMAAGTLAGGVGGAALGTYLGMGMAAIGGPLGLAVGAVLGSVLGGVVSKLFNTSTSIKDQGITGKAMSLGNVDALGFTAQAYADVNTKKKAFGISYSSKDSTKTAALSDEMNDQFTMIITSMGDTIRSAADVLGLGGAAFNAHLNSFVVDLGKISLKDLSAEEQQKALETAFSKMGDDMAKFGVAGLEQYRAVGEGYLETLARVANDQMQVNDVLTVLGKSFNTTGLGAVALSQSLIAAAGDLETLTGNTSYFVQNFLTEAERMAPITKSVNDAMGKLGVTGVTTVDQFKQLVLAQDLNTSAGQAMYAQLIALAEPFKTVADYAAELAGGLADVAKTASEIASERKDLQSQLDQLTLTSIQLREKERAGLDASNRALYDQVQAATAVAAARDVLSTAYDRESSAITATIDKTKAAAAALRTFLAGMLTGDLSPLSDASRLAVLRSQMATATPDTVAASSTAYLQLLKTQSGSALEYARGFASAQQAIEAAAMGADAEGSVALQQLSALDKSVAGIIDVNKSVISVRDALAAYAAAGGIAVPADGGAVVQVVNFSAPAGSVPASQNQANDTAGAEVVAELKLLREEMKLLRAAAVRGADAAVKGAELLDNVSGGGGAFLVEMESA